MKAQSRGLLCLWAMLTAAVGHAHAEIHEFDFSGTITTIMGSDGNPGGAFTSAESMDITVGDTYHGMIRWDSADLDSIDNPATFATRYNYLPATPTLTIDSTNRQLTQKIWLALADNVDPVDMEFSDEMLFGIRQTGVDLQPPFDFLILGGDVQGFDDVNETGTEFLLVTFDPTGSALSGTGVPDPLTLLNHSYFVFLELDNGAITAAAIGLIPEPTTGLVLGSGVLALLGVRRKHL